MGGGEEVKRGREGGEVREEEVNRWRKERRHRIRGMKDEWKMRGLRVWRRTEEGDKENRNKEVRK